MADSPNEALVRQFFAKLNAGVSLPTAFMRSAYVATAGCGTRGMTSARRSAI